MRFTAEEEDDEVMLLELKEAFRLYDKEGNGYIPVDSLREILLALDDQLTTDQLNEMIEEIDSDSSGTVDFDGEYGRGMAGGCKLNWCKADNNLNGRFLGLLL